MMTETSSDESGGWTPGKVIFAILVGPILIGAWHTGSTIAAKREAWRMVRELSAVGADGRPDPRALLHVSRGSGAFLRELDRRVHEGPLPERAGIARSLGASKRLEMLKPLILYLRDGLVDPEEVVFPASVAPQGWPLRVFPADLLALDSGEAGCSAMAALARDEDGFVAAWAGTFLCAWKLVSGKEPALEGSWLRFLGSETPLLRERAARLCAARAREGSVAPERSIRLADGAENELRAHAGPDATGRLAACALDRKGELAEADIALACDPRVTARAARALARGDPGAAKTLALLAPRDPGARDALVAAVSSGSSPEVTEAARAALAGLEGGH